MAVLFVPLKGAAGFEDGAVEKKLLFLLFCIQAPAVSTDHMLRRVCCFLMLRYFEHNRFSTITSSSKSKSSNVPGRTGAMFCRYRLDLAWAYGVSTLWDRSAHFYSFNDNHRLSEVEERPQFNKLEQSLLVASIDLQALQILFSKAGQEGLKTFLFCQDSGCEISWKHQFICDVLKGLRVYYVGLANRVLKSVFTYFSLKVPEPFSFNSIYDPRSSRRGEIVSVNGSIIASAPCNDCFFIHWFNCNN